MDCPWTSIGHSVTGTTEKLTEADYVAFFHQFLGFTNNPALASLANVQCPCQRYLMGGDGAWDHINCCPRHSANWFTAHEHVFQALERSTQSTGGLFTCVHVYIGTYPWRGLAFGFLRGNNILIIY